MKKIFTLICILFLGLSISNGQEKLDRKNIDLIAKNKTEKVTKLLDLSENQAKEVKAVYTSMEVNMNSLSNKKDDKSIAKFNAGFMTRMQSILTTEQFEKFKAQNSKDILY